MIPSSLSRRRFLKSAGLAGLATGLTLPPLSAAKPPPRVAAGKARNVIFLVSDGMNIGTLMLAHQYQLRRMNRSSAWVQLIESKDAAVHRGLLDTGSANSMVTDSAAAGSSWGCGHRVNNGTLNITPDGKAQRTILEKAKETGRKTALVTTTRVTHATPASFAVATENRNAEDLIAEKYLDLRPDILLGGGARHFDPTARTDGRDLAGEFSRAGYKLFRSAQDWPCLDSNDRLLGLFHQTHLPFEVDRLNTPTLREQIPSLAEMSRRSLAHLDTHPGGFFIQIEAARVDHAAHANDIAATLLDQIAFDEAVQVALKFVEGREDTLLIVTTDHGTGGLQVNGRGPSYSHTDQHFDRILTHTSYDNFLAGFPPGPIKVSAFARELPRIFPGTLPDEPIEEILAPVNKARGARGGGSWSLGGAMRPHLLQATSIGWTSHEHTGEFVEFTAMGPGSDHFGRLILNKDVHWHMCEALGIRA
ncbi:MAG: alkaline phosphatase [Opitutales bacterium]|nr:alkaline phosphatase [Opitutales bacterium]